MPIILPYVPRTITVHLGLPDQWAENVTVSFPDYVKNVASSEIYPTWEPAAIRANVLAIISFALNRVYTEFYHSRGYDFQITSTTQYDQKFIRGRNIFENISQVVDEIFNDYIRRQGYVEPLAAKFCNGTTSTCDGLSQWGSQELAQDGLNSMEILRHYYGSNIELVVDAPIQDITASYPGSPLRLGSVGENVVIVQAMLNRISQNYPAIPKISPATGIFGEDTRDAVRTFQRIFNLDPDGVVGKATWYKMVYLYAGILQLAELVSQGQTFVTVQFQFSGPLEEGDIGPEVGILQYMLALLAQFDNSLSPMTVDGQFGPATTQAVRTYQQLVGLTPNGYVDENTWDSIYRNFALADYFLRRDTVRAQSLREDALPVMSRAGGPPEDGPARWDSTSRMGQYPGRPLNLGQRDGQNGQRGAKV
ncbi:MAG: spore cortex-lytic protein [Lawsonibacter sp.]|nr:spore cortex-lytic protein [Lawsonibacter sp.]